MKSFLSYTQILPSFRFDAVYDFANSFFLPVKQRKLNFDAFPSTFFILLKQECFLNQREKVFFFLFFGSNKFRFRHVPFSALEKPCMVLNIFFLFVYLSSHEFFSIINSE
jgi:hypothetical protein